jgi:hypothetical protein
MVGGFACECPRVLDTVEDQEGPCRWFLRVLGDSVYRGFTDDQYISLCAFRRDQRDRQVP